MDGFVIVCPRNTNESISYGWVMDARKVTHGAKLPSPKTLRIWRKMASARLSAKFSSYDPFKTARLNQAGRKNKLRHSCGVTATLATKNHKALYSLLRDKPPPEVANSGGPVPVARSRWPGPGGPVPVARFRWPGLGGPVPVPL